MDNNYKSVTKCPELIAVKQAIAAKIMGVSRRTIFNWDKQGLIKGKIVGGVKLYSVKMLQQLIETDWQPPSNGR